MLTVPPSRAKEKYRRRLLDKEFVSDSELVTSTTPELNRDDPLPRLGGSRVRPERQIEFIVVADVQGTGIVWELFHHIC